MRINKLPINKVVSAKNSADAKLTFNVWAAPDDRPGADDTIALDVIREGDEIPCRCHNITRAAAKALSEALLDALDDEDPKKQVERHRKLRSRSKGDHVYKGNEKETWEVAGDNTGMLRLRVPGGWLYAKGHIAPGLYGKGPVVESAPNFVPMPDAVGHVI